MARKKKKDLPAPEWSYNVATEDIAESPQSITISPDAEERKKLARRMGIDSLDELSADLSFARDSGELVIHVTGSLRARVTQSCVVSGDPVVSDIQDEFEAWFADSEAAVSLAKARRQRQVQKTHAELPVLEEREDPEPITEGKINAGELVAQYLSLAINPYPHAEGVVYEHGDDEADNVAEKSFVNPFAALKEWKNKQE